MSGGNWDYYHQLEQNADRLKVEPTDPRRGPVVAHPAKAEPGKALAETIGAPMGNLFRLPHPLVGSMDNPLMHAAVLRPADFLTWFYTLGGGPASSSAAQQHMETTYPDEALRAQAAAVMLINADHPTLPSWCAQWKEKPE